MSNKNKAQVSEGTPELVLKPEQTDSSVQTGAELNEGNNEGDGVQAGSENDAQTGAELNEGNNEGDGIQAGSGNDAQKAPDLSFVNGGLIPGAEFQAENFDDKNLSIKDGYQVDKDEDLVKIRVLLPLAGRFLLPYDPGAEIEINRNQADLIVEAAYGEFISDEDLESSI